jgi:WhiB family transcriptional regulator, redox-sensing transcriptional regulator
MAATILTDWWSVAACRSRDPELFFPISSSGPAREQIKRAKAGCAGCQVRPECLDFALRAHVTEGVWGGTSADERELLLRRRACRRQGTRPPPRP